MVHLNSSGGQGRTSGWDMHLSVELWVQEHAKLASEIEENKRLKKKNLKDLLETLLQNSFQVNKRSACDRLSHSLNISFPQKLTAKLLMRLNSDFQTVRRYEF
jgi:hypothetical protein